MPTTDQVIIAVRQKRSWRHLLTVVILLFVSSCDADTFEGTVERIIDGDTFIMSGARIRVWGINAPEIKEPYGPIAKAALARIVAQDAHFKCDIKDNDRYKRVVALCKNKYGDIGEALVRDGHAYDWPRYSGGHYYQAEHEARAVRAGLWRIENGK